MSVKSIIRGGWVAVAAIAAIAVAAEASAAPGGGGHGGGGGRAAGGGGFRGGYGGGYRGGYAGRGYYGYRGGYYGYGGYRGGWGWGGWGWGLGWGWTGLGWYLPVLPLGYATYYWGGVPYYYANNGYYVWDGAAGQYEAVQPPAAMTAPTAGQPGPSGTSAQYSPASATGTWTDLFAYPKAGQSLQQQTQDRQECRAWATAQSAFDPTQPPKDPREAATKKESYLRAEEACLTARNYSVK